MGNGITEGETSEKDWEPGRSVRRAESKPVWLEARTCKKEMGL